jgi:hypothetical protein
VREHKFTTDNRDPQEYALPDDFLYMIDQTGWMRGQNVPLAGPLSSQDWQYLLGRDLVSSTIYASFRLNAGVLKLFPQSNAPQNEEIAYEYMSENWVQPNGQPSQDLFQSQVLNGSDIVLIPDPIPSLYLKARFLSAKGFDTTAADAEFSDAFLALSGMNKSAAKINMGRNYLGYPYLDAWRNLPDTRYGSL